MLSSVNSLLVGKKQVHVAADAEIFETTEESEEKYVNFVNRTGISGS